MIKKKDDLVSKIQEMGDGIKTSLSWITEEDGKIITDGVSLLIPFIVGSPYGTILPFLIECADYTVRKKFLKHYSDFTHRLSKIRPIVNEEFVKSNMGQKFLRDTFNQIIEQNDEEKIEFQKKFLLNTFVKTDPDKERLATYQLMLISLEVTQLRILSAIFHREETVERIMKQKDASKPEILLELKNDVRRLLVIDDELFERSLTRLEYEGLLRIKNAEMLWCSGKYDGRQFEGEAVKRMISSLQNILTAFGSDFMTYFKNDS